MLEVELPDSSESAILCLSDNTMRTLILLLLWCAALTSAIAAESTDKEKAEAIRRWDAGGETQTAIAKSLGIHQTNVSAWVRAARKNNRTLRAPTPAKAAAHIEQQITNAEAILAAIDVELARREEQIEALRTARKLLAPGS